MTLRTICILDGCNRKGRNKGLRNGKIRFDKYCHRHYKRTPNWKYQLTFDNSTCERCGWKKAPCDRHRVIPALGYVKGNVLILCPNCHREEETNKLALKL